MRPERITARPRQNKQIKARIIVLTPMPCQNINRIRQARLRNPQMIPPVRLRQNTNKLITILLSDMIFPFL